MVRKQRITALCCRWTALTVANTFTVYHLIYFWIPSVLGAAVRRSFSDTLRRCKTLSLGENIFLHILQKGIKRKPVWLWLKLLIFLLISILGAGRVARYETLMKLRQSWFSPSEPSYLSFNFASLQHLFLVGSAKKKCKTPTKVFKILSEFGVNLWHSTHDKSKR